MKVPVVFKPIMFIKLWVQLYFTNVLSLPARHLLSFSFTHKLCNGCRIYVDITLGVKFSFIEVAIMDFIYRSVSLPSTHPPPQVTLKIYL